MPGITRRSAVVATTVALASSVLVVAPIASAQVTGADGRPAQAQRPSHTPRSTASAAPPAQSAGVAELPVTLEFRAQDVEAQDVEVQQAEVKEAEVKEAVAIAAETSARRAAAARARRSAAPAPAPSPRQLAEGMIPAGQFHCFDEVITHESGWDVTSVNPGSGAYGLGQALPGDKMASAGADWRSSASVQIRWVLGYMDSSYGSPCGAWDFWQSHSWY